MDVNGKCRKLSEINIYRIDHSIGNLSYVEIYFDEHMRLIAIPISQGMTMISMDVYPFECSTDFDSGKRCIAMATPHIELCSYSLIDTIYKELGYRLPSVLMNVEALSICLEEGGKRKCEIVNLKLFISRDLNQVLEMCIEDFQQAVDVVKHVCTSQHSTH